MKWENARVTSRMTMLVDILCMLVAFYIAAYIRGGILTRNNLLGPYGNVLIILILSIIVISNMGYRNTNFFKRDFFEEMVSVVKDQVKICMILFAYMIALQIGSVFSRIFLLLFFSLNILITYVARSYLKLIMLISYKRSSSSNKVMLITLSKNASTVIKKIRKEYEWNILINSIALWDKNRIGDKIEGIEVVATRDNLLEVARLNVVDEVFIHLPSHYNIELEELILEFEQMGVIVHMNLDIFNNLNIKEKTVNEFAGHQVITFSTGLFDLNHAIIKRCFDLIGGLCGCILTIIITIFLAPAIKIESRGPIFFSQIRVGKNGRKFKIYKFRSMYADAEKRKQELMDQNEMEGLMFKITDDPRITKIGKFIRKTSLDEFPQFFNVLLGDMSLVGTRPPTEDEFLQYEGRHKRRLSLKPGLTGLWQVSGRSDINNFEEVVKMDLEYIDNWSIRMDLKLIMKTVGVVVLGRGSR